MKEESTPYTGADSLKQIVFFLRFNLPDFNLQNYLLVRVHKNILLLLYGDFKRGLSPALSHSGYKSGKNPVNCQTFRKKSCGQLSLFTVP
jgi:hypothetical protein